MYGYFFSRVKFDVVHYVDIGHCFIKQSAVTYTRRFKRLLRRACVFYVKTIFIDKIPHVGVPHKRIRRKKKCVSESP